MKLFGWAFIFEVARPGTVWWHNVPKSDKKPSQRADSLLAFERVFIRQHRVYLYSLKIGRLRVLVADTNQIWR